MLSLFPPTCLAVILHSANLRAGENSAPRWRSYELYASFGRHLNVTRRLADKLGLDSWDC